MLRAFLKSETAGGIVLMAAAVLALIMANSSLAPAYGHLLHLTVGNVSFEAAVNDGLMAIFFLLVGLEIKRELIAGELSTWPKRALPGLAAAGGMLVPALIFAAINAGSPDTLRGWAIPSATDIAFSLAVLALLGKRVPTSLRIFLTALAILDDLGAVLIIALFYAHQPMLLMLGLAAVTLIALYALNYLRVTMLAPYLVLGVALWFFVLNSGVHATIAGVLLATAIPLGPSGGPGSRPAPLLRLEHFLQPWVAFGVVPLFGFANAGVALSGLGGGTLTHPLTIGIALGLFIGKQVGVFASVRLAVAAGIAERPRGASNLQLYGLALLCGIGFTMSLFIGLLAFDGTTEFIDETKIGVLAGSLASALLGWLVLRFAPSRAAAT